MHSGLIKSTLYYMPSLTTHAVISKGRSGNGRVTLMKKIGDTVEFSRKLDKLLRLVLSYFCDLLHPPLRTEAKGTMTLIVLTNWYPVNIFDLGANY